MVKRLIRPTRHISKSQVASDYCIELWGIENIYYHKKVYWADLI